PPRSPLFPYTTLFRSPPPPPPVSGRSSSSSTGSSQGRRSLPSVSPPKPRRISVIPLHLLRRRDAHHAEPITDNLPDRVRKRQPRSEEHTSELQSPYDL